MTDERNRRRRTLRRLTYGLFVATTTVDGGPTAASVSWLSQCSFDPPLVMVAVQAGGVLSRGLRESGEALVHVPSATQRDLVKRFFVAAGPEDDPPLHGEPFDDEDGLPALRRLRCRFRIRQVHRYEGGDHHVVVARVVGVGEGDVEAPLRMHDTPWSYGG